MIEDSFTQKPWNIPKRLAKTYGDEELQNTVNTLSRTSTSNFYIKDYKQQKYIISSLASLTLLGHPKEVILRDGFDFTTRVLDEKWKKWHDNVHQSAFETLFNARKSQRKNFVLNYNIISKTPTDVEILSSHTLTPYQFCKNGNLWLSLGCVKIMTTASLAGHAYMVETESGEHYDFIDNKFQLLETEAITQSDIRVLRWMGDDLSTEQICELLGISTSNFCRKRKKLFRKLGVNTPTGAVYKAQQLKII